MKSLFEELGGTYHQKGDYLLPDLSLPKTAPVGVWGKQRRYYLKTQRGPLYNALLLSDKLNNHLTEVNIQAEAMFFQLVKQIAEQEGITERFKAESQMEWVQQMNSIRQQVIESVRTEIINR